MLQGIGNREKQEVYLSTFRCDPGVKKPVRRKIATWSQTIFEAGHNIARSLHGKAVISWGDTKLIRGIP